MNVKIGNLITEAHKYRYIAHGCNCFNVMGAGIAKDIKDNLNEAYIADLNTNSGDYNKLGNYSIGWHYWPDYRQTKQGEPGNKHATGIFNLYTQYDTVGPMPRVNYAAMLLAMEKMAYSIRKWGLNPVDGYDMNIGMPLIGYGLAGGNLNSILSIISRALDGLDYTLYVYEGDPNAESIYNEIKSKFI